MTAENEKLNQVNKIISFQSRLLRGVSEYVIHKSCYHTCIVTKKALESMLQNILEVTSNFASPELHINFNK